VYLYEGAVLAKRDAWARTAPTLKQCSEFKDVEAQKKCVELVQIAQSKYD